MPIVQKAGWAQDPVWTGAENLAPTEFRSPYHPARSQSLYRLSYPAHRVNMYIAIKRRGTRPVKPEETRAGVTVVVTTRRTSATTTTAKVKFTPQQAIMSAKRSIITGLIFL